MIPNPPPATVAAYIAQAPKIVAASCARAGHSEYLCRITLKAGCAQAMFLWTPGGLRWNPGSLRRCATKAPSA